MLTTTHASWTAGLAGDASWRRWAIAGAVAPDAPAIVRAVWLLARRRSAGPGYDRIYGQRPWREVHRAVHAVWAPATVAALARDSRGRALAAGWAGHLAVDLATHSDDAWPPLWPLSDRRLRSPVSYWQRDRHARLVLVADLAANVLALRRRPGTVTVLAVLTTSASLVTRASWRWRGETRPA